MLPTRRLASHKTHQEQKCSQAERVVAAQWHCVDERSARGLRACGGAILYLIPKRKAAIRSRKRLTYVHQYVRTCGSFSTRVASMLFICEIRLIIFGARMLILFANRQHIMCNSAALPRSFLAFVGSCTHRHVVLDNL